MERVSVAGEAVVPLTETETGENEQFAPAGSPPVQARLTEPLKPFTGERFRLYVAGCPEVTVCDVPLVPAATVKSDPFPERATACAAPLESVTVNVPVMGPVVVAAKTTAIAQPVPAGTEVPMAQVPPFWENAVEKLMPVMLVAELP